MFRDKQMAKVSTHQLKPLELSAMDVGCSSDNEICKDISTATTISTLTTDASEKQEQGGLHLDFKCFYWSEDKQKSWWSKAQDYRRKQRSSFQYYSMIHISLATLK